jgi:hypothetical protein
MRQTLKQRRIINLLYKYIIKVTVSRIFTILYSIILDTLQWFVWFTNKTNSGLTVR